MSALPDTSEATTPAWTMEYSGPRVMLATKYGKVKAIWTDAGHAHISANASSGHDPGDIEYRGKHWYVSVHLYAADGWGEDPREPGYSNYRSQFTESGTSGSRTIAPAYRAAIVTAITRSVSTFAAEHPDVLTAAEHNHLQHDLTRAEEELASARESERAARAGVRRIHAALNALST